MCLPNESGGGGRGGGGAAPAAASAHFPITLNTRLASLSSVVSRGDDRPLGHTALIFNDPVRELKVQTDRLSMVLMKDLAAFNVEARRLGLTEVQ